MKLVRARSWAVRILSGARMRRRSRLRGLAGVFAVLTLVAAGQVLFLDAPASAQPSTPQILVPSNGATVSGTDVVLDAAVTGATSVTFHLLDTLGNNVAFLGTATLTPYGWILQWNSVLSGVANGSYLLIAAAVDATGVQTLSDLLAINLDNVGPINVGPTMYLPSNDATVGGLVVLDASTAGTTPGFSSVQFDLEGVPIGTATSTIYGWVATWTNGPCQFVEFLTYCQLNTNSTPSGTYPLQAVAVYPGGITVPGPAITITLVNPTIVLPAQGATFTQGSTVVFDLLAPGAAGVQFYSTYSTSTQTNDLIANGTPTLYGWIATPIAEGNDFPIQTTANPSVVYFAVAIYNDPGTNGLFQTVITAQGSGLSLNIAS